MGQVCAKSQTVESSDSSAWKYKRLQRNKYPVVLSYTSSRSSESGVSAVTNEVLSVGQQSSQPIKEPINTS